MKRDIFQILVSVGLTIALIKLAENNDKAENPIYFPVTTEDVAISNDNSLIIDNINTNVIDNMENINTMESTYIIQNDTYDFVNEEVYRNLHLAKSNWDQFYRNGQVSVQMKYNGTDLNHSDSDFIDSNMWKIYNLIFNYVASYESGDIENCAKNAKDLLYFYDNTINKDFLYRILIMNKLPAECQADISRPFYNSLFDQDGNILLDNGKKLSIIGIEDDILETHYDNNFYDKMLKVSEWYEKLPTMLLEEYAFVENVNVINPEICYLWNETKIENICAKEWENLKISGQNIYGFDLDSTVIRWLPEANSYAYESQNGIIYGLLNDMDTSRVDHLYEVQDAIVTHIGDVSFLDSYIKNMISYQSIQQYTR